MFDELLSCLFDFFFEGHKLGLICHFVLLSEKAGAGEWGFTRGFLIKDAGEIILLLDEIGFAVWFRHAAEWQTGTLSYINEWTESFFYTWLVLIVFDVSVRSVHI